MASTETIRITFAAATITEAEMRSQIMAVLTQPDFMNAKILSLTLATPQTPAQAIVAIAVEESDLSDVDIALYYLTKAVACDYKILEDFEDINGDYD